MTDEKFSSLKVSDSLHKALREVMQYEYMTKVQGIVVYRAFAVLPTAACPLS
jgi:superfamily II DNA/RNA helicase